MAADCAASLRAALSILALSLLCACSPKAGAGPDADRASQTPAGQTPSGLPVPRYVVLKFDPVNARSGPSDDHRLLWTYHVRGLPVQVVAETKDWRRICDPDGGLSWVHRRTTDGRRSVMNTGGGAVSILKSPRDNAPVAAYLAPRAMAVLDRCQGDWCKIAMGGTAGWTRAGSVWGTSPTPQCR
ncbi:MAG TPA: SH3 domain-containing protein [Caulobacteraceae bacterium]|jgi:SH3-like domain-containing protein